MLNRLTNIISTSVGCLVRIRLPTPLDALSVRIFAALTGANVKEAEYDLGRYRTISEFFTRGLLTGVRPVAESKIVSPVDGVLREAGSIVDGEIPQVKGRNYQIAEFLESKEQAYVFRDGHFYNFYLAPHNYHHVHSPIEAKVVSMTHIPGSLFPVNDFSLRNVEKLFCRNERVVVCMESEWGKMALVFVGALNVGSVVLAFDRLRTNIKGAMLDQRIYNPPIVMRKSQHLGGFGMGSSVVLLLDRNFASNVMLLEQREKKTVQMGESLARSFNEM